jgi:hypothetical protein
MARQGCIFCGTKPTTLEHIVSQWTYDVFSQDPRGVPEKGEHRRYSSAGVERIWESAKPTITARCVCKGCNDGWMNDIESAARPALSAMIRGEHVILDQRAQDEVAAWLGLKAIVERYSNSPIKPVQPEWIAYYREHRCPPDTWHVRISRYLGARPVRIASGSITVRVRHNLVPFALQEPGLLFGIAIGQFCGQVLGANRKTVVAEDPLLFSQIWPHPLLRLHAPEGTYNDLVAWPPESWLSDSDFERYTYNITGKLPLSAK